MKIDLPILRTNNVEGSTYQPSLLSVLPDNNKILIKRLARLPSARAFILINIIYIDASQPYGFRKAD